MRHIDHLSSDMRQFYRRINRRYALQEQHRRVLIAACEAHDRSHQARELLERDGITINTRHGEVKVHPAVAIERDSRIAFMRAIRELGL